MEYAHVILASLFSILALFLITKLLGCRQMNQLSMFDYINGITIGSIAAELAASWGKEFWQWAIALVIYGLATFLALPGHGSLHPSAAAHHWNAHSTV